MDDRIRRVRAKARHLWEAAGKPTTRKWDDFLDEAGELVAIDLKLCALTLVIIVAVGLLSGVYPAWKAGRVRPLDSIRGGL